MKIKIVDDVEKCNIESEIELFMIIGMPEGG